MIHDSEKGSANFNHDALIRLRKKIANEDVRERTHLHRTHRYGYRTRHLMQPVPSTLTSEDRASSARQHSPQKLAERAAIILALNVTSGRKPNPSQLGR